MPTGPAPAFDCSTCGRRIGRKFGHYLLRDVTADRSVPCVKCLDPAVHYVPGTRAGRRLPPKRRPVSGKPIKINNSRRTP